MDRSLRRELKSAFGNSNYWFDTVKYEDVAEVKGFDAYQELDRFIADQGIAFAQFNSPIYTWLEGQKSIQKLLRKIN